MASRKWWLLAAGGLLVPPAAAQQQSVTLPEAIRLAERVQPRIVQALGTARNSSARLLSARGAYLPNLSVNTNGSTFFSEGSRIDPNTGELTTSGSRTKSVSFSINSQIEVFDGFRRNNELGAARANEAAADASLVDARFQQALQTTNSFFDALAAKQLLLVREASLRRAEQQLETSVARLQAGAATRSDSLRSLVGVGNAQLQLVTTQATLAAAEATLGRLVGEESRVAATDDSTLFGVVETLDAAVLRTEALARSPQVQAADAQARSTRAALSASRSTYWPSLILSGNYQQNATSRNDYTFLSQNQVSLALSWNLFNRFSREQNVAAQAVSADNAAATAADTRRLVLANLTARLADLDAARLRIEITGRSQVAAEEDVRVQQERYRLGASTILDLMTAQEALTQAEVDAVTARFDYLRAQAAIEALIGRPL